MTGMTARGKTTPASTGGSYAPHSGRASRVELNTPEPAAPTKSAADVLYEQAAAAAEHAQGQMCVAIEKRVADLVRAQFPSAQRIVLSACNEGLVDATVYADSEHDPLATVDWDSLDPMYNRLDDALQTLLELGWSGHVDSVDEHHIVFADADAAFEPHRTLAPQPIANGAEVTVRHEMGTEPGTVIAGTSPVGDETTRRYLVRFADRTESWWSDSQVSPLNTGNDGYAGDEG